MTEDLQYYEWVPPKPPKKDRRTNNQVELDNIASHLDYLIPDDMASELGLGPRNPGGERALHLRVMRLAFWAQEQWETNKEKEEV